MYRGQKVRRGRDIRERVPHLEDNLSQDQGSFFEILASIHLEDSSGLTDKDSEIMIRIVFDHKHLQHLQHLHKLKISCGASDVVAEIVIRSNGIARK